MDSAVRGAKGFANGWRVAAAAMALLVALFAFLPAPAFAARQGEREDALASSGIQFPEGFDRNTIGEVKGKVSLLTKPESGPVWFKLEGDYDSYTVFVAPAWYWRELAVSVKNGDRVIVKGSKTVGRDGGLYIVAQWMKEPAENSLFRFRDKTGGVLWTGQRVESDAKRDAPGDSRNSLEDSGKGSGGWGSLLDAIKGARGGGKSK